MLQSVERKEYYKTFQLIFKKNALQNGYKAEAEVYF